MSTKTDNYIKAVRKLPAIGAMMGVIYPAPRGRYAIWVREGKLRLSPKEGVPDTGVVICSLSAAEINHGMTSRDWENLADKLFECFERGEL